MQNPFEFSDKENVGINFLYKFIEDQLQIQEESLLRISLDLVEQKLQARDVEYDKAILEGKQDMEKLEYLINILKRAFQGSNPPVDVKTLLIKIEGNLYQINNKNFVDLGALKFIERISELIKEVRVKGEIILQSEVMGDNTELSIINALEKILIRLEEATPKRVLYENDITIQNHLDTTFHEIARKDTRDLKKGTITYGFGGEILITLNYGKKILPTPMPTQVVISCINT